MSKVRRNLESAFHRFEAQLRFELEDGFGLWIREENKTKQNSLLDGSFCHSS